MMWAALTAGILLAAAVIVYQKVMWPSPMKVGEGKKQIACVGDSITYSLGVVGRRRRFSYPAQMVALLGKAYSAVNYGLNDRTLLSTADKPYFAERVGRAAWETGAETVIFMLGSNDCKRKNWNARQFEKEYEAVIRHYLDKGKRLFVMLPPRIFYRRAGKTGYDNEILRNELIPIVRALAEKYGVPCVDLYALTENHPEWFPDKLHPEKAGNLEIAKEIVRRAMA